jgi:hypothetical protein
MINPSTLFFAYVVLVHPQFAFLGAVFTVKTVLYGVNAIRQLTTVN